MDELRKNNFFNDETYQNYNYTKKTIKIIEEIKSDLENGNLIYEDASIKFLNFTQMINYQFKFRLIFLFNKENDE